MPAAPDDQVGTIAEETAKLVATLAEWVRVEAAACPFVQELKAAMTDLRQAVQDVIDGVEDERAARSTAGFQTIDLDDPEGT